MNQHYTIHHVSMVIANIDQSQHFYCDILGLEQDITRPKLSLDGLWLKVGQQQIHLLLCDNPDATTGRPKHGGHDRHLALNCDNIATLKQRLTQHDIVYTVSKSGRQALFCRDPDGNGLEFVER